jgi:hypothetical protein
MIQKWEYCLLTATPISGLDGAAIRLTYQAVGPHQTTQAEIHSTAGSSLAALGQLLNELGADGWELVAYDTTTNRGVFKRPAAELPSTLSGPEQPDP